MSASFLNLQHVRDDFYWMLIDPRYYMLDNDYDKTFPEIRLAISYGPNYTMDMNKEVDCTFYNDENILLDSVTSKPFFAPPKQDGRCVYGLHTIIVDSKNDSVWLADEWLISYPAKRWNMPHEIIKTANKLLKGISDNKYSMLCYGTVCSHGHVTKFVRPLTCIPDLHATKYKNLCSSNNHNTMGVKRRTVTKPTYTNQLWFKGIELFSYLNHNNLFNNN